MKSFRKVLAAALCCAAHSAVAGHNIRGNIQPLVREISLAPQSTVTRPLAVRIVDDSGNPLGGVRVWFDIAPCLPTATTACPPLTAYGRMDGKSSLDVVTDHAGIAAVEHFVGGQGNANYEVTAMVPEQTWNNDKHLTQRGPLAIFAVRQHGDSDDVPELDGVYSSAARDGEGWEISLGVIGDKVVVVGTWYTFDEGKPLWLTGSAEYDPLIDAAQLELYFSSGAKFGAAFNPSDVVRTRWGTAGLQWAADGGLQVIYTRQDGNTGTLNLQRIFPTR